MHPRQPRSTLFPYTTLFRSKTMKKPLLLLPLFLTLLFATSGCDLLDQDSYQEYIMIESYAYAGLPYPDILITRTMPADVAYSEADAAISEATVRLSKVGENG